MEGAGLGHTWSWYQPACGCLASPTQLTQEVWVGLDFV